MTKLDWGRARFDSLRAGGAVWGSDEEISRREEVELEQIAREKEAARPEVGLDDAIRAAVQIELKRARSKRRRAKRVQAKPPSP